MGAVRVVTPLDALWVKLGSVEYRFCVEHLAGAIRVQVEIVAGDLPAAVGEHGASCHEGFHIGINGHMRELTRRIGTAGVRQHD